jgi:hypothetical protein
MQNEQNVSINICGNETMNLLCLVLHTELRSLQEKLKHHVLDISILDTLQNVWRSEIPPNNHIFPGRPLSFANFFDFLYGPCNRNHTIWFIKKNSPLRLLKIKF